MNENQSIDWEIISKVLCDTASEQEQQAFEQWLDASPVHRAYFERAKGAVHGPFPRQSKSYDTTFFELKLRLEAPRSAMKRRWLIGLVSGVAACVAVLLLMLFFGDLEVAGGREHTVYQELAANYTPGSHKAMLALADGSSVALGDSVVSLRVDGVRIDDAGQNQLNYSNDVPVKEVAFNTLIVPRGGYYAVQLADGTVVHLNSDSQLTYPTWFDGDVRSVSLMGEGYFEVAHNPNKPFVVAVKGCKVEVLGTEFNISAYADDQFTTTTLINGSVKVSSGGYRGADVLSPGMQLQYDNNSHYKRIDEADVSYAIAWKSGEFAFDNTSMESLLKITSRWYDFRYEVLDESILQYNFSGHISKQGSLDYLFRVLNSAHIPMSLSYIDGILFIDRNNTHI